MPYYEYQCKNCGKFEKKQRITEDALQVCPQCGAPVERLISKNIGVVFKGSGFYTTDHKSEIKARHAHHEMKKDNEALADGDKNSFNKGCEETKQNIGQSVGWEFPPAYHTGSGAVRMNIKAAEEHTDATTDRAVGQTAPCPYHMAEPVPLISILSQIII